MRRKRNAVGEVTGRARFTATKSGGNQVSLPLRASEMRLLFIVPIASAYLVKPTQLKEGEATIK